MALVVEDGTGLSNSESYESVINADTYAANFGRTEWTALATPAKEIRLRLAAQFLDTMFVPTSKPLVATQALAFPRQIMWVDGVQVSGIHRNVKKACVDLATYPGLPSLLPEDTINILRSRQVKVDGLEKKEEFRDGIVGKHYWVAESLMAPFIRGSITPGIQYARMQRQ